MTITSLYDAGRQLWCLINGKFYMGTVLYIESWHNNKGFVYCMNVDNENKDNYSVCECDLYTSRDEIMNSIFANDGEVQQDIVNQKEDDSTIIINETEETPKKRSKK